MGCQRLGQGVLTDAAQYALRGTSSSLRRTPGLTAASGGSRGALTGGKSRMTSRTTNRHPFQSNRHDSEAPLSGRPATPARTAPGFR